MTGFDAEYNFALVDIGAYGSKSDGGVFAESLIEGGDYYETVNENVDNVASFVKTVLSLHDINNKEAEVQSENSYFLPWFINEDSPNNTPLQSAGRLCKGNC